jgi:hypothetical protein
MNFINPAFSPENHDLDHLFSNMEHPAYLRASTQEVVNGRLVDLDGIPTSLYVLICRLGQTLNPERNPDQDLLGVRPLLQAGCFEKISPFCFSTTHFTPDWWVTILGVELRSGRYKSHLLIFKNPAGEGITKAFKLVVGEFSTDHQLKEVI